MSLLRQARERLGYHKRIRDYGSRETADLIQRNLATIVAPLRSEANRIVCDEIGLSLDPKRHAFYLEGMRLAQQLVREGVGTFVTNEEGDPEFHHGSLKIVPETAQELDILHEVLGQNYYDLDADGDWFVWDVGMNVGVATLFFAGVKGWETLGYEPFPRTFAAAARNVARNGLEARVHLRNVGLAGADGTATLEYEHGERGSNGLFGNHSERSQGASERVEVRLMDAAEAFREALTLAEGRPLLAKIDCEGAEYAIIDRLAEEGLLKHISVLAMEYHTFVPEHDPERLASTLRATGFVLRRPPTKVHVGQIFAVRPCAHNQT